MIDNNYYNKITTQKFNPNVNVECKISKFGNGTNVIYDGSIANKINDFFSTINYSVAFCGMDTDSPITKKIYSNYQTNPDNKIEIYYKSENTTPFAFGFKGFGYDTYSNGVRFTKSQSSINLINTDMPWSPTTNSIPFVNTSYNYGGNNTVNASGSGFVPITEFDYRTIVLVPIIEVAQIRTGFTLNDLKNSVTVNEFNGYLQNRRFVDSATLFGTDGAAPLTGYDIILSVGVIPKICTITNDIITNSDLCGSSGIYTPLTYIFNNRLTFNFTDFFDSSTNVITSFDMDLTQSLLNYSCGTLYYYNSDTQTSGVATINNAHVIPLIKTFNGSVYNYILNTRFTGDYDKFYVKNVKNSANDTYNNYYICFYQMTDSTEFFDYICKCVSYFGMFFSNSYVFNNINFTDEKIYQGIVENGITHGNYSHGVNNVKNDNYNWTDAQNETNYDFKDSFDVTETDRGDLVTTLNINNCFCAGNLFNFSLTDIEKLFDWLNTKSYNSATFVNDFKGINPTDYIYCLNYFPFDITNNADNVRIDFAGVYVYDDNGTCTAPTINRLQGYTSNSYNVKKYYNDFRDFAPYTTAFLKLPYANTFEIDLNIFYNHSIKVDLIVDLITATGTYFIYRDSLLVKSVSISAGVPVFFTGGRLSDFQTGIINERYRQLNDIFTSTTPTKALFNSIDYLKSENELSNQQLKIDTISNTADLTSLQDNLSMYLIFKHSTTITRNTNAYKNLTGFLNTKYCKMNECSNFTVIDNILIDFPLTDNEKNILLSVLKNGIII